MFDTPILFLIFNRPETTARVFEQIKKVQPKYLFVAADGARKEKPGEEDKCNVSKNIILHGVDWDCELKTLFKEDNLGCGLAVSGAISWFFENVEEGIILEDDCLPERSFFKYCETLLEKYRYNRKIFMISGDNFRLGQLPIKNSYAFSKYCHVWGWATWKRAWQLYDYTIDDWPEKRNTGFLQSIFTEENEINYWQKVLNDWFEGKIDTWDYQWYYTCWKYKLLSIEPSVNLVMNIGFGADATHFDEPAESLKFGNQQAVPLVVSNHPSKIGWDEEGDRVTFKNRYADPCISPIIKKNLMGRGKDFLFRKSQQFFPGHSFKPGWAFLKLANQLKFQKLYLTIKYFPSAIPQNEDGKRYIHLGCGDINWPKFINVDIRPYQHIHYLSRVNKLPFFKDNSADLIYVSHCLEHISYREVPEVIKEWKRILKKDGLLRISVPDFEMLLNIYQDNNRQMNSIIESLMGGQDYGFNFYFSMFNYSFLEGILYNAGFSQVQRWQAGQDEFANLPDWSNREILFQNKSYKVSLNIEAVK